MRAPVPLTSARQPPPISTSPGHIFGGAHGPVHAVEPAQLVARSVPRNEYRGLRQRLPSKKHRRASIALSGYVNRGIEKETSAPGSYIFAPDMFRQYMHKEYNISITMARLTAFRRYHEGSSGWKRGAEVQRKHPVCQRSPVASLFVITKTRAAESGFVGAPLRGRVRSSVVGVEHVVDEKELWIGKGSARRALIHRL